MKRSHWLLLLVVLVVGISAAQMVTTKDSQWWQSLVVRSRLLFGYGSEPKARLAYANDLLKIDPDSPRGLFLRATAYEKLGQADKAVLDYDRLIEETPANWFLFRQRASCKRALMHYAEAAKDLHHANELAPLGLEDYTILAQTYYEGEQDKKALAACEQALIKDVDDIAAYHWRARLLVRNGDPVSALRDLNTAISLADFNDRESLLERGYVNVALSRGSQAVNDAQAYLQKSKGSDALTTKAVLIGGFGYMLQGQDQNCSDFVKRHGGQSISAWPRPLLKYLCDEISDNEVLNQAKGKQQEAQAHAYVGLRQALSGQYQSARENLGWVKNHCPKTLFEYAIASTHLDNLSQSTARLKAASMKNPASFFVSQNKSAKWNPDAPEWNGNCGPASLAMAFRYFRKGPAANDDLSPEELIEQTRVMMTRKNQILRGTDFADVTQGARAGGLKATRFMEVEDVDSMLDRGHLIVAGGYYSAPGSYGQRLEQIDQDWQGPGHFILLMGRQGTQYIICDPAMKNPHFAITRNELESFWNYYHGTARGGVQLWAE